MQIDTSGPRTVPWPTCAEGYPLTLGEMTPDDRREQLEAAARRYFDAARKWCPAMLGAIRREFRN